MKLLICIAFHYVENNLQYLRKVLNNIIDNYKCDYHIVIDTNTKNTYNLLQQYPMLEIIVHEQLEHGFHLTLMHRKYIKENKDKYDVVMYSEDDILIPFINIVDFMKKIDKDHIIISNSGKLLSIPIEEHFKKRDGGRAKIGVVFDDFKNSQVRVTEFNYIKPNINMISVPISIAEGLDKYTILQIKNKFLPDNIDIKNEMQKLDFLQEYIEKYNYEYTLLFTINRIIWQLMEDTQNEVSHKTSIKIFKENDARSRIKRKINDLVNSNIREVKSYNKKTVKFVYPTTLHPTILNLYIEYLNCYYDSVDSQSETTLTFEELYNDFNPQLFEVINNTKNKEYTVRDYACGGMFGDYIYVCYVMMSEFLSKNIKANFYIDSKHGTTDINKSYTDLKCLERFPYINSVNLCKERTGNMIDLDNFRKNTSIDYISSLCKIFNIDTYKIPWIYSYNINLKYEDTIFIHRSTCRHNPNFPWNKILSENKCTFIGFSNIEYDSFCKQFSISEAKAEKSNPDVLICNTLEQFIDIINNCKDFVSNLTSLAAVTMGLYTSFLCELDNDNCSHYLGLEQYNKKVRFFL